MEKASLYKQLNDSTIQCELCNHFCVIKDGRVGICRVRKNKKGSLYSLVYGQPVAMNVDPVEKKPLFHFQPGSLTYSLGTYGCNFACANCQNWDISQETNIEKKLANLPFVAPEEIINETIANDCQSISYTYNEPTVFTEYALKIMKLAHQQKLKNIWVSNGYMSKQCLEKIIPFLNAINIDLKSFTEKFYQENCHARLQPILNSLQFLQEQQVHLEITTLIIPTLSDDLEMLKKLADFIANKLDVTVPWHLSRFSPNISWKLNKLAATDEETIYEVYEIGKQAGLKYVYVGNLPGDAKENTYCPNCNKLAIERNGYEITRHDQQGICAYCEKSLDIIE